jgi:PHP family Zn ribbon phosphoesterase
MSVALKYDLHIHTALSPCADNDMTPATVAGMAKLAGLDLIAISDHNSARNLPAAKEACHYYGLKLLPAIEVTSAEEIHLLCYFPSVEAALEMSDAIYDSLPDIKADPEIWGEQLVMDTEDNVIARLEKLLTNSSGFTLYETDRKCRALGGMVVPAHCDREAYSMLSVLGMFPEDIHYDLAEMRHPGNYANLCQKARMPQGLEILFSSDAHSLSQLDREVYWTLKETSPLMRLVCKLY